MDDPFVEPVRIAINGELDLHHFSPKDIKHLVPDYLQACHEKAIYRVRIIHGKGSGTLRRSVHAVLDRLPLVASYRLADEQGGSWGATIVTLKHQAGDP